VHVIYDGNSVDVYVSIPDVCLPESNRYALDASVTCHKRSTTIIVWVLAL